MRMAFKEPVTTNISTEAQKVYELMFLGEQTQTTATQTESQARPRAETLRRLAPLNRCPGGYDPAVIRFYEDVITELQRELARYKAMVAELSKNPVVGNEGEYTPGQPTTLPPDIAKRLRASTAPPSQMTGHEI
jgi:hypothetical protein